MAIALKALLGVYLKSAPHLVLIFCVYDDSMLAVVMPHTVTSTIPNLNSEYVIINCKKTSIRYSIKFVIASSRLASTVLSSGKNLSTIS